MRAYALLGGPKEEWPTDIKEKFYQAKAQHDFIIGVDRGSLLLEEMQIIPDLAIGDFDSLKPPELELIEKNVPDIRYSNPIKDLTDSELMLQATFEDYQVKSLTILGATGGRLDHFLVNLMMLLNPAVTNYAEKITLIDKQNLLRFYLPGKNIVPRQKGYSYFGVVTLSPVSNLSIEGARYSLSQFSSTFPRAFSSNEFLTGSQSFNLSFDQGLVVVIFSKDIDRFHNI